MKRVDANAWVEGEPVDDWYDQEDFVKTVQDDRFHIGQGYEDEACGSLVCVKCGGDQFHVGQGSYYTAIKCPNCGWEVCVHDG